MTKSEALLALEIRVENYMRLRHAGQSATDAKRLKTEWKDALGMALENGASEKECSEAEARGYRK